MQSKNVAMYNQSPLERAKEERLGMDGVLTDAKQILFETIFSGEFKDLAKAHQTTLLRLYRHGLDIPSFLKTVDKDRIAVLEEYLRDFRLAGIVKLNGEMIPYPTFEHLTIGWNLVCLAELHCMHSSILNKSLLNLLALIGRRGEQIIDLINSIKLCPLNILPFLVIAEYAWLKSRRKIDLTSLVAFLRTHQESDMCAQSREPAQHFETAFRIAVTDYHAFPSQRSRREIEDAYTRKLDEVKRANIEKALSEQVGRNRRFVSMALRNNHTTPPKVGAPNVFAPAAQETKSKESECARHTHQAGDEAHEELLKRFLGQRLSAIEQVLELWIKEIRANHLMALGSSSKSLFLKLSNIRDRVFSSSIKSLQSCIAVYEHITNVATKRNED